MGYLLGVLEESRLVPVMLLFWLLALIAASENQTGSGSLVSVAEELPDSFNVEPSGMTELILRKERKQARYFTEKLGEAIGLDMILVPAGTFWMGSPDDEPDRSEDEGPQHEVNVSSFFMGRYPVTQAQWRFVAALTPGSRELDLDPSNFKEDKRPVEQVSWYDAVEFCDRLAQHTGRPYRLPSEAEWEYACRSGTVTPFYFGKTLTTEIANYDGNYTYNDGPKGEYREETTPVDQFEIANAFGLCDMHGNVFEWCQDHWHENYEGAPTDGSAWLSANENASRVSRGGSWRDYPRHCRSAYRFYDTPDNRYFNIGFRVVCSAPRTL
jgi:formylglycine-generating enzyme required for sulfatase activity